MNNANLSALSLSALKALAAESGIVVTGDKRSKQTWILAIESAVVVATPDEDTLDDTFDLDGWDAPITIPDAEMEAIAHAADLKAAKPASGAVLVVSALVCVLVLVFRVAFGGVAIALKLGSYVVRLFGKYDCDLDLSWQFAQFRRRSTDFAPCT